MRPKHALTFLLTARGFSPRRDEVITRSMHNIRFKLFGFLLLSVLAAWLTGCDSKSSISTPAAAVKPPVDVSAVRSKAETGDAGAQAQLGRLYAKGEGVTNSYKEAVKWYRLAADQGNAEGQFGLGELYDVGQGVPRNLDEAVKLYRLAADQGHAGAQYTLGFLYENRANRGFRFLIYSPLPRAKWLGSALDERGKVLVGLLPGPALYRLQLRKMGFHWQNAKNFLVQRPVIIPRVHVSRNIIRIDRNARYFVAMRVEKRLQAARRIQFEKLSAKTQIDQDRVTTASLVGGNNKPRACKPFVD